MSTSICEDDYKPAFLTNGSHSINPSAVSFFQDQAQNVNRENYLYPLQGGIQQVNFSTSSTSQISREMIKTEDVSSATYSINASHTISSTAVLPSNCFNGNTVYGSLPPDRDIQFRTSTEPSHLGTVSAQICVPRQPSQSHLFENNRTVLATPFFGNTATFANFSLNSYQYNYSYPVTESVYCNAYSGYQVPGLPSFPLAQQFYPQYPHSFDEFYRNNDSTLNQFPETSEPNEYKPDPTIIGATSGADMNELVVQPSTFVLPNKKKLRKCSVKEKKKAIKKDPESTENNHASKQKSSKGIQKRKRGKAKVNSSVLDDDLLSSQGRRESEIIQKLPKKKKKTSSPGGIAPIDPDARRRKENMAFEKGCFIFRISDLENSYEPVNFVWFVENYQLLQKYVLRCSDVSDCYEYFRTERYSGWLADEPWLYYPAKVEAFFDESDETERVTINFMPTKTEIDQYRNEELNKKALSDNNLPISPSANDDTAAVRQSDDSQEFEEHALSQQEPDFC